VTDDRRPHDCRGIGRRRSLPEGRPAIAGCLVADRPADGTSWLGDGWPGRVERTSAADAVYQSLRAAVVDGRLAASTRLGEKELAAQFRVSRTPVREALRRLEQRRLVTALPTGGYQVAAWNPTDVRALYRVRGVLERLVAGEAAGRATADDLAALGRMIDRPPPAPRGELVAVGARRFHRAVARIAGIRLAADLLDDIADHEDRYRRHTAADEDRRVRARLEHHRVLEQIRAGDRAGAERAMAEHLDSAAGFLLQGLGADQEPSPAVSGAAGA